jgi:hypothetical protein
MQLETNDITKKFPRNPSREQRRLHHRAKLAVRDPAIATQELSKWREVCSMISFYCIQRTSKTTREVHNTRSWLCITRTCKWQETYATRDPETAKHKNRKEGTKETVKLIAIGKNKTKETDRQYLILVIKNSQTCTMYLLQIKNQSSAQLTPVPNH